MKRFLAFLLLLATFAYSIESMRPEKTPYTQIETRIMDLDLANNIVIFPANGVNIGESGVIVKHIDNGDLDMLIAQLEVISISRSIARAKIGKFTYMEQKYLPTPREIPSVGDKVLFRTFASKALVIAPSQSHYDYITKNIKNVDFIHPDLFSAYLFNLGHPDPKIEHFKEFCQINSVGIAFIEVDSIVAMLDCYTFKHIANVSISLPIENANQVPFFSRIKEISSTSIISKLRPVRSKNYYKYFGDLVKSAAPKVIN